MKKNLIKQGRLNACSKQLKNKQRKQTKRSSEALTDYINILCEKYL